VGSRDILLPRGRSANPSLAEELKRLLKQLHDIDADIVVPGAPDSKKSQPKKEKKATEDPVMFLDDSPAGRTACQAVPRIEVSGTSLFSVTGQLASRTCIDFADKYEKRGTTVGFSLRAPQKGATINFSLQSAPSVV
jgi:hypothetical protein